MPFNQDTFTPSFLEGLSTFLEENYQIIWLVLISGGVLLYFILDYLEKQRTVKITYDDPSASSRHVPSCVSEVSIREARRKQQEEWERRALEAQERAKELEKKRKEEEKIRSVNKMKSEEKRKPPPASGESFWGGGAMPSWRPARRSVRRGG
eukprot:CAMPEP_0177649076 /NCGR_PEP_ID=MMETSP0447-20121125/11174_1 /TAXON_ID=0 /ORGANISM="Stygamoeba regulata, Strain BSH-02190019" /LENGTH=151 /DNA_ID=CAMNT_0019151771 /DNA_START=57 /DNA_END=512 /DNA_ORIENTATION=+